MSVKMENNEIEDFKKVSELKETKELSDSSVKKVGDYDNIPTVSPCKQVTSQDFRQLYKKAFDGKRVEDIFEDDEDDDDDDNDSFITITTSNEESDYTLENSESSDSGIIEHDFDTNASYGINPMFTKGRKDHMSTTSRACTEFVFFPHREETDKTSSVTVRVGLEQQDGQDR